MTDRMLTAAEVAELLDIPRGSVYRGIPGLRPIKVGARRVRYRLSEVEAVMEGRVGSAGDQAGGEESDMPANERDATLSAAANDLVRMLVEENFLPVNEVNDRLIPLLNKRWTALFESWGGDSASAGAEMMSPDQRERLAKRLGREVSRVLSAAESRGEVARLEGLLAQISKRWKTVLEDDMPRDAEGDDVPGDEDDDTMHEGSD